MSCCHTERAKVESLEHAVPVSPHCLFWVPNDGTNFEFIVCGGLCWVLRIWRMRTLGWFKELQGSSVVGERAVLWGLSQSPVVSHVVGWGEGLPEKRLGAGGPEFLPKLK